jgi:hypothetical protein
MARCTRSGCLSRRERVVTGTLLARRRDVAWAFYKSPKGFIRRSAARDLAPGLSIVSAGHSCPIPLLSGRIFGDLCAEIEIMPVPFWLRELAFAPLDSPPGKTAPVPASSRRTGQCRPAARSYPSRRGTRARAIRCAAKPDRGHGGYRISRRR